MPQVLAYGRQSITEDDIETVCHVPRPDYLNYISSLSTMNCPRV
jgi:hypothetical protein